MKRELNCSPFSLPFSMTQHIFKSRVLDSIAMQGKDTDTVSSVYDIGLKKLNQMGNEVLRFDPTE